MFILRYSAGLIIWLPRHSLSF